MERLPSRKNLRIPGYDYTTNGAYFVTLCAEQRRCIFSEVVEKEIFLSKIGSTIENCWVIIPNIYAIVELGEWCLMPNHLHGILIFSHQNSTVTLQQVVSMFKRAVTKQIGFSVWQRNYYEHVIRTESELDRVSRYIQSNPLNWETDEDNPNRGVR